MTNRYFIQLSYKGTHFHGWQRQPNAVTVQQKIEEALQIIHGKEIAVTGTGRTDAGVHAQNYIAHFDIDIVLDEDQKQNDYLYKLNALLPSDIVISHIFAVQPDAHARFDAIERSYFYNISYVKNPFLSEFSWIRYGNLNIDLMNEACKILLETSDFTSFAKLHSDNKTNICKVKHAHWNYFADQKLLKFEITADRFLRNMVRSIVGTMVDLGRNKINLNQFKQIIEAQDRNKAGLSAPAQGLCFASVQFPYIKNGIYSQIEGNT